MDGGQDAPQGGGGCPLSPDCEWQFEYPPGYEDPPWEPTGHLETDSKRFAETVLAARRAAIKGAVNAHLADHGIHDIEFVWETLPPGEEPQ